MKFQKVKIINALFLIISCNLIVNAKAETSKFGLFVEPAVTYELGDSSATFPSPVSNSSGSVNGFGLGARLGLHLYDAFFIGIDGRYSQPHFLDSSMKYDSYASAANWGAIAGIQVPNWGMRAWAGPIFGATLDPKESGNFDVKMKDSSGYRVGTGFRVTKISLNVEYQQIKYKEVILEKIGPFAANTSLSNVTFKNNSWIASVSFPIEL
jgi:hypothetical protein